jgi:hypothetical protein
MGETMNTVSPVYVKESVGNGMDAGSVIGLVNAMKQGSSLESLLPILSSMMGSGGLAGLGGMGLWFFIFILFFFFICRGGSFGGDKGLGAAAMIGNNAVNTLETNASLSDIKSGIAAVLNRVCESDDKITGTMKDLFIEAERTARNGVDALSAQIRCGNEVINANLINFKDAFKDAFCATNANIKDLKCAVEDLSEKTTAQTATILEAIRASEKNNLIEQQARDIKALEKEAAELKAAASHRELIEINKNTMVAGNTAQMGHGNISLSHADYMQLISQINRKAGA